MTSVELRTGRLFDLKSGRALIAILHRGPTSRVPLKAGRVLEIVEKVTASEPNGVLTEGTVFGRNVWQTEDSVRISSGLREAVPGAYGRG